MKIETIKINKIQTNNGQIEGLPPNPRFIRDTRFEGLKKSIKDAPDMLEIRELIVYPQNGHFVTIGGNMRLRACRDLGFKEMICKVLPETTTPAKLAEIAVKDNISFGADDHDILFNEWTDFPLQDWGFELPEWAGGETENSPLQEEIILPVEMAHFLISTDINNVDSILPFIQQIKDLQICEVESNVN